MPTSNSLWVDVVDIPPYENIGWQVKCRSLFDMTKAWVENPKFVSMMFSKELSDEGVGSIDFDMDSKLFQETLSSGADPRILLSDAGENVWEIYYNGGLVFQWIAESAHEKQVDSNGARIATISGPGVARILKWATILPLGSPNKIKNPPKGLVDPDQIAAWGVKNNQLYRFRNTPIMSDYITLLQDAQKRGTSTQIEPMFTRANDSAGKKWLDTKPPIKAIYQRKTVKIGPWAIGSSTLDQLLTASIDSITAPIVDTFTTGGKQLSNKPGMVITAHGDSSESLAVVQARGEAVKSRLAFKKPLGTYTVVNKGNSVPIGDNATEEGATKNRRVEVTYTALVPPPVIPEHRPVLGVNLLDFLGYITGNDDSSPATMNLDWLVRPPKAGSTKFRLDVRPNIGSHREKIVKFFESNSIINKERTRDRNEIINYVGLRDNYGAMAFYATRDSIAKYGQREAYRVESTVQGGLGARQRAAKAYSLQNSKEKTSWTLTVADRPNRSAFIDYDVGDWIGVENQDPYSPTLKMSELYDEFAPPSLNTDKWANTGQAAGQISILSGGGLRLKGTEATKFARVTTVDDYNFYGSSVSIQVDSMISGGGGDGYAQFKVQRFDDHYFSWWSNGSVIRAYYHPPAAEGGLPERLFEGVWNPTYYKYLRISHRATTNEVIWESSSNAKNWTYRARRKTNQLEWWLYKVVLEQGDNTTPLPSGNFDVRRVNTQAGATGGLMNIDRTPGYGTDVHRVKAITINIDSSSNHTTELTLESSLELRARRTARRLAQVDQLMWRNNLPGGVLKIDSTYGTISSTQQIVQMGEDGTAIRRGATDTSTHTPYTFNQNMGSGSRLRWDDDLSVWLPAPNVWFKADEEPEISYYGDLWLQEDDE